MNSIYTGFKQNTEELIDQIIDFRSSGNDKLRKYLKNGNGISLISKLNMAKIALSGVSSEELMKKFVSETSHREEGSKYTILQMIKSHNEDYFFKSKHVLGLTDKEGIREQIVDGIKLMTREEKYIIWQYMDVYVELIEEYKKYK